MLDRLEVLSLEPPFDEVYGRVRAELETTGRPIGAIDTLIAAHALAADRILVIDNVSEFSRMSGLTLENWLS